ATMTKWDAANFIRRRMASEVQLQAERRAGLRDRRGLCAQRRDQRLDGDATGRAVGAANRAIERWRQRFGGRQAGIHLTRELRRQRGIDALDEIREAAASDRFAVRADVTSEVDVADPDDVEEEIAVRVVAEAGVLVLLILGLVRHRQPLAG